MGRQASYLTSATKARPLRLPSATADEWEWQRYGRCRGIPSEIFFPEDDGRDGCRRREAQAKRICQDCPVVTACREHALRTPERYGVWGAMSARERARQRSSRR
ncbi:WhiB family transcriptional regulator [Mycobacterium sp.]